MHVYYILLGTKYFNQINTSVIPQFFVVAFEGNLQPPPIPRANCPQQVSPLLHVQLNQVLQQGALGSVNLGAGVCWTLSLDKLSIEKEQAQPGSGHQFDIFVSGAGHGWSVESVLTVPWNTCQ